MAECLPWDADCDATRVGLERFLRALICTGSHFTVSFSLAPVDQPSRVTVFFRVHIPIGHESAFLAMAQIDEIRPPPRVQVGMTPPDASAPLRKVIKREKGRT